MFILKKGRCGLRTVSAVGAQWDETVAGDICLSIKKWNLRKNEVLEKAYFSLFAFPGVGLSSGLLCEYILYCNNDGTFSSIPGRNIKFVLL